MMKFIFGVIAGVVICKKGVVILNAVEKKLAEYSDEYAPPSDFADNSPNVK